MYAGLLRILLPMSICSVVSTYLLVVAIYLVNFMKSKKNDGVEKSKKNDGVEKSKKRPVVTDDISVKRAALLKAKEDKEVCVCAGLWASRELEGL